jgi:hypothetical protein
MRAVRKMETTAAARVRPALPLTIILGLGLLIRMPALWTIGYRPDISFWKSWLSFSVVNGIGHVYSLDLPGQAYPPLFLYILWGLGHFYHAIWPMAEDSAWLTAFVKLPAVAADIVAAWLLAWYAGHRARSRAEGKGGPSGMDPRLAAALLAFNPVLIWLSSYWGQVDILHGGFAAASWGAALAGAPVLSGILLACGALVKPQGLLIVPVAALLIARRTGLRGLARASIAGSVAAAVVCAPFLVSGAGNRIVGLYAGAGSVYPYVSVNAFNPWWCVTILRPDGMTRALMSDMIPLAGPITLRVLGLSLFAAATGWILWRVIVATRPGTDPAKSDSRLWRLLTLQWLAFFLLATQVHERYLVPAILSLAPAVVLERRRLVLWLAMTVGILLNVLYMVPGTRAVERIVVAVSGKGVIVSLGLCLIAALLVRDEHRE